jgi:CheY-like chemotaxis protein
MKKKLALVVEDYEGRRLHYRYALKKAGLEAIECASGEDAIRLWRERHPHLVIMDLEIHGAKGMEVLRWWKWWREPSIPEATVIVISRFLDLRPKVEEWGFQFWPTMSDVVELDEKIRKVVGTLPAFRPEARERLLDLTVAPGDQIHARLDGNPPLDSDEVLSLDCDHEQNTLQDSLTGTNWRSFARKHGYELHSLLFPGRIAGKYSEALTLAQKNEFLRLRFTIPEACAGVGYELLNQLQKPGEDFLVLKHPFTCRIRDLQSPCKEALNRAKLNEMAKLRSGLRVLLVGADVRGKNEGPGDEEIIDNEIRFLQEGIPQWFGERGIHVVMADPLFSRDATFEAFTKRLEMQDYDIVHFSGHAQYDETSERERGLRLWRSNTDRTPDIYTAKHLEATLRQSTIRFFYLNACWTGARAGEQARQRSRLSGLVHGLLKAGVNSVLGYRIPVSGVGAPKFAKDFYLALAEEGELDFAVLRARQGAEREDDQDPIWLSAVLYMQ